MMLRAADGLKGMLVNADTGEPIRHAIWADTDTGDFEAVAVDQAGNQLRLPDGRQWRYRGRARLRFVPAVVLSAPKPEPEPIFVPAPPPARRGVPVSAQADRPCQHYGCIRPAVWKTSDEVELPRVVGSDGRQFKAAKMIRAHWWCEWHYRWPRLFDGRGELIEDVAVVARPD